MIWTFWYLGNLLGSLWEWGLHRDTQGKNLQRLTCVRHDEKMTAVFFSHCLYHIKVPFTARKGVNQICTNNHVSAECFVFEYS